jgi:hypothetical protein
MYNLLNKILSRFHLKLVSTKPDTRLVKETVRFLNTIPPKDLRNDKFFPGYRYVGDVTFVNDKTGKTYLRQEVGRDYKYFDYDGDSYTPEQLQEKLNNE